MPLFCHFLNLFSSHLLCLPFIILYFLLGHVWFRITLYNVSFEFSYPFFKISFWDLCYYLSIVYFNLLRNPNQKFYYHLYLKYIWNPHFIAKTSVDFMLLLSVLMLSLEVQIVISVKGDTNKKVSLTCIQITWEIVTSWYRREKHMNAIKICKSQWCQYVSMKPIQTLAEIIIWSLWIYIWQLQESFEVIEGTQGRIKKQKIPAEKISNSMAGILLIFNDSGGSIQPS